MRADEGRRSGVAAAGRDALGLRDRLLRARGFARHPAVPRERDERTGERDVVAQLAAQATASAAIRALSPNRCAMYSSAAYSSKSEARSAAGRRCACRTTAA